MKTKVCLCAILLSHSVYATLIDFNDIPIGTQVSSLNPYGAAVISSRFWLTDGVTPVPGSESFTRGAINTFGGSPAVVIQAGPRDATQPDEHQWWNIELGVSFRKPVSTFTVDLYSFTYTSSVIYSGFDGAGEEFTSSVLLSGFASDLTHFNIAAPTGGYITGFHFSQFEDRGGILLAMDNLDYTLLKKTADALTVPDTIGLPTFVLSIGAVLVLHRRMKVVVT
jgi:hypothetical protein